LRSSEGSSVHARKIQSGELKRRSKDGQQEKISKERNEGLGSFLLLYFMKISPEVLDKTSCYT